MDKWGAGRDERSQGGRLLRGRGVTGCEMCEMCRRKEGRDALKHRICESRSESEG
jgi:hypothetical protein